MSKIRPQKLEDIQYELRLLFGADKIVRLIKAWDSSQTEDQNKFGNIINYFKDSIYLHSRNLLNLLTAQGNTEIGKIPDGIQSLVYGDCKSALERYVMHLGQARDQKGTNNIVADNHLSQHVHELASESKRCLVEWSKKISNNHKEKLNQVINLAEQAATADTVRMTQLLGIEA